jgi:hypothetical protein
VNAELLVCVLEVLAHRLGRDAEATADFPVRPAFGDERDHFALARCECIGSAWGASAARRRATKLSEVRKQEIEHPTVPFAEVGIGAVELEPCVGSSIRLR